MGHFTFVKGSHFLHPEEITDQIQEGFVIDDGRIDAQVSAEHIKTVMENYLTMNKNKKFFLFLEIPVKIDEENIIKPARGAEPGIVKTTHRKVYYLDDLSEGICLGFLDMFGEILINDGLSAFGFGVPGSELGKYKYNEMILYGYDGKVPFTNVFLQAGIPEREKLVFAADLFSDDNPGVSERYEDAGGRTIYEVAETLKEMGLYEAETRADDPDADE